MLAPPRILNYDTIIVIATDSAAAARPIGKQPFAEKLASVRQVENSSLQIRRIENSRASDSFIGSLSNPSTSVGRNRDRRRRRRRSL
jgi:hypothetical protein